MTGKTQTLGQIIGRNAHRLRIARGLSLEELSRVVRGVGLEWSVSRIVAIERGAREPKLATLLVLANALECTVEDLLQTDQYAVDLGTVSVSVAGLRELFAGPTPKPWTEQISLDEWAIARGFDSAEHMTEELGVHASTLREMAGDSGLVEERTARALGITPEALSAVSFKLRGQTLSRARDNIARETGRPLGEITSELREEIRVALQDRGVAA